MTKDEYFKFSEQFFKDCIATSRKKNNDYTGDTGNPFANLESCEVLGIKTEIGILTRMQDKMMRLASFAGGTDMQVTDESIQDTLRDLANYTCLLAGYLSSKDSEDSSNS